MTTPRPVEPTFAEFGVSYEGPALQAHSMPVRDLAPALLALGQAFERANGILNGNAASVSLDIRAARQGSFEIVLLLRTIYDQTTGLFAGDLISSAANLKELFFGAGASVISVIRQNRGKPLPAPVSANQETVTLEIDHLRLSIPIRVYELAKDNIVRDQIEAVVRPLLSPGIDRVAFKDGDRVVEMVTQDEAPFFEANYQADGASSTLETLLPRQMLRAETVNFAATGKWRLSDGGKTRWYSMSDESFQKSIDVGAVSFRKGDVFICEVIQRQTRDPQGYIHTQHEIVRVIEHLPPKVSLL